MISDYDNVFGFICDIFKLNDEDLLKCCHALQQKLTDQEKKEADVEK